MRVAVFSARPYDKLYLQEANKDRLDLVFFDAKLEPHTCELAAGCPAVCVFVNDDLDRDVLLRLFGGSTRMIALRCTGFNNVDLYSARNLGITVARVPAYSPESISEYTVGLILALARKICRAWSRTRDGNFSLDGLLGFNICDRRAGVIGTGRIGALVARALHGLGCEVLACDRFHNDELAAMNVRYVERDELLEKCNLVSLHCPLNDETRHLIDERAIERMPEGTMLINTSRGALIDSHAVINGLKTGRIGALAIDVYEEEAGVFYEDNSNRIIQDDLLARFLTFPNVIVTGHQAFFTVEALRSIARQTIDNLLAFENGTKPPGTISFD